MKEFHDAEILAAYAALPEEVQTHPILEQALLEGKTLLLPRVVAGCGDMTFWRVRDLEYDLRCEPPFGIPQPIPERCEPVSLAEASLVLVPGVAFDRCCNRLGRGKGYYDHALSQMRPKQVTVGLAFEDHVFREIPTTPNDIPVGLVVTEKYIYAHRSFTVTCDSPGATEHLGFCLGSSLPSDKIVSLIAPLGSGKTVIVKGMVCARGGTVPATSPTYTLVNVYETQHQPFRHLDLFRWNSGKATEENIEELLDILSEPGLIAVEWADRAEEHLPMQSPCIRLVAGRERHRVWQIETFLLEDSHWLDECLCLISHKGLVSGI